jgi:hypothetical protein
MSCFPDRTPSYVAGPRNVNSRLKPTATARVSRASSGAVDTDAGGAGVGHRSTIWMGRFRWKRRRESASPDWSFTRPLPAPPRRPAGIDGILRRTPRRCSCICACGSHSSPIPCTPARPPGRCRYDAPTVACPTGLAWIGIQHRHRLCQQDLSTPGSSGTGLYPVWYPLTRHMPVCYIRLRGEAVRRRVSPREAVYLPRKASVQVAGPFDVRARPWSDRGRRPYPSSRMTTR